MTKKEQNSKEYGENLVKATKPHYVEGLGMDKAKKHSQFRIKDVEESYEAGWDKAKSELLKEFEHWFCNGYCRFYGYEDYCSTCPLKKEECWLKD